MCLGIPGKIVEFVDPENGIVKAEVAGVRRNVSIQLLADEADPVRIGDWILIHVGFALCRIDEAEAEETLRMLESMGAAYADELQALQKSEIEGG